MAYTNKNMFHCIHLKTILVRFKFLVKDCQPIPWKWMPFNNADQYIAGNTRGVSIWRENYSFPITSSLYCMVRMFNFTLFNFFNPFVLFQVSFTFYLVNI